MPRPTHPAAIVAGDEPSTVSFAQPDGDRGVPSATDTAATDTAATDAEDAKHAPASPEPTDRWVRLAARGTKPLFALLGFTLFFGAWWLLVDVWQLPRFRALPGLVEVLTEWTGPDPRFGVSLFTGEYYTHIWASLRRVLIAFALALALGVPTGLLMGWSTRFRQYVFPVFETLRPIPILAWVPLAILMFASAEGPVVFLTFLPAFFATTLNSMLGVRSIDRDLVRAAYCLGSNPRDVFRHVVVPGALPHIVTGLQIAMGVAWFSLVAGEMVAGRYGLGYLINEAFTTSRYPTIVIGMATLGIVGAASSLLVRTIGSRFMRYRAGRLAHG